MDSDYSEQIYKILWIEEAAQFDYANWVAPLNIQGNFDLTLAENTTKAMLLLQQEPFDAIIVDIRLPPGEDSRWIKIFNKEGAAKFSARLGMSLLHCILKSKTAQIQIDTPIGWVTAQKIGILTVESQDTLKPDMESLGISVFQQKTTNVPETVLLDLVKRILAQQAELPSN